MKLIHRPLLAATLALATVFAAPARALPTLSQAGNLLANGNFEAGSTSSVNTGYGVDALSALTRWRQWANSSGTVSSWVTSPLIEGLHTAELQGGVNDGLYQYMGLGGGSYTVSGWVKVQSGAVHLGLAWNGGGAAALTASATQSNTWEYLTVTANGVPGSLGGALVYGAASGSHYFAEGLWLNSGTTSTSPFAPGAGFNPSAVPEPGAWAMALGGLALLGWRRRAG